MQRGKNDKVHKVNYINIYIFVYLIYIYIYIYISNIHVYNQPYNSIKNDK